MSVQVPKGYKQTEVGVIPEDWECLGLGEVLKSTQLGNLCITRFQASQCLNECDVLLPLALKMPAFRGHLAF